MFKPHRRYHLAFVHRACREKVKEGNHSESASYNKPMAHRRSITQHQQSGSEWHICCWQIQRIYGCSGIELDRDCFRLSRPLQNQNSDVKTNGIACAFCSRNLSVINKHAFYTIINCYHCHCHSVISVTRLCGLIFHQKYVLQLNMDIYDVAAVNTYWASWRWQDPKACLYSQGEISLCWPELNRYQSRHCMTSRSKRWGSRERSRLELYYLAKWSRAALCPLKYQQ